MPDTASACFCRFSPARELVTRFLYPSKLCQESTSTETKDNRKKFDSLRRGKGERESTLICELEDSLSSEMYYVVIGIFCVIVPAENYKFSDIDLKVAVQHNTCFQLNSQSRALYLCRPTSDAF